MKDNITKYDWFGYSEDDTLILSKTIEFLKNNSIKLYNNENKVYSISRLVYDKNNNWFFSVIITASNKKFICNNQLSVIPTQRYSACWFYPKIIMTKWINSPSFFNFNSNDIRAWMAFGYAAIEAITPISDDNETLLKCIHLGYSGKYYFKHPAGYHTLPLDKLFN